MRNTARSKLIITPTGAVIVWSESTPNSDCFCARDENDDENTVPRPTFTLGRRSSGGRTHKNGTVPSVFLFWTLFDNHHSGKFQTSTYRKGESFPIRGEKNTNAYGGVRVARKTELPERSTPPHTTNI